MQASDQTTTRSREDSEVRLTLPGMRSKVGVAPPTLERLESFVTSPCVSDATLTSRRLRELIPCTPSPMYAYDLSFGMPGMDGAGRMFPRFFPFSLNPEQGKFAHGTHAADDFGNFGAAYQASTNSPSVAPDLASNSSRTTSPTCLVSPNRSLSITTPIAENVLAEEHASLESPMPSDLVARIKQLVKPNGTFDMHSGENDIPISRVIDEVIEMSKDQIGSRYLQQLLESGRLNGEQIHLFFLRVLPETRQLTVDPFGNYVVQKLVECVSSQARDLLLAQLVGNLCQLAIHMYGCRVVQKLIELSPMEKQIMVSRELIGHVVQCVEDQNGNHVIQKLIEKLPSQHLAFIVNEFLGSLPTMAVHCYGCRVVQRLLEKLRPEESSALVAEILSNLWQLSQDQYGNYVIQHVLLHGTSQNKSVIIQVIASHIIEFSCHKYASNIAEKALLCSEDRASRDLLIGAVLGSGGSDSPLHVLMKDRFANYVIQRCIEFSYGQQRISLVQILRVNLPMLKRVIYGKHIATAIERIIRQDPHYS